MSSSIKLMADYSAFPLWTVPSAAFASHSTRSRLPFRRIQGNWASQFDATLDASDPINSGFRTTDELHFRSSNKGSSSGGGQAELGRVLP